MNIHVYIMRKAAAAAAHAYCVVLGEFIALFALLNACGCMSVKFCGDDMLTLWLAAAVSKCQQNHKHWRTHSRSFQNNILFTHTFVFSFAFKEVNNEQTRKTANVFIYVYTYAYRLLFRKYYSRKEENEKSFRFSCFGGAAAC